MSLTKDGSQFCKMCSNIIIITLFLISQSVCVSSKVRTNKNVVENQPENGNKTSQNSNSPVTYLNHTKTHNVLDTANQTKAHEHKSRKTHSHREFNVNVRPNETSQHPTQYTIADNKTNAEDSGEEIEITITSIEDNNDTPTIDSNSPAKDINGNSVGVHPSDSTDKKSKNGNNSKENDTTGKSAPATNDDSQSTTRAAPDINENERVQDPTRSYSLDRASETTTVAPTASTTANENTFIGRNGDHSLEKHSDNILESTTKRAVSTSVSSKSSSENVGRRHYIRENDRSGIPSKSALNDFFISKVNKPHHVYSHHHQGHQYSNHIRPIMPLYHDKPYFYKTVIRNSMPAGFPGFRGHFHHHHHNRVGLPLYRMIQPPSVIGNNVRMFFNGLRNNIHNHHFNPFYRRFVYL